MKQYKEIRKIRASAPRIFRKIFRDFFLKIAQTDTFAPIDNTFAPISKRVGVHRR